MGWFGNAPASTRAWTKTGQQLGTFTDRLGKPWTVAENGKFITFTPVTGGMLWGTIDAKGALDSPRNKGVVNGSWRFNGSAIGIEPLGGFGTAVVRRWVPVLR